MDRLIYVTMSGASQALDQQASIANNLANASTTGFRAQLSAYRSVPVDTGNGNSTSRTYAITTNPGTDYTPGPVQPTGNALDVAIQGNGWLAVKTPDGQEAYTRAGNMHVDQSGQLVTGTGQQVVGNSGPIAVPPGSRLSISEDGTISSLGAGQAATNMTVIDKLKLVNPGTGALVRGDDGLFRTSDDKALTADTSIRVQPGAIEGSNVNTVTAMVQMIDNARAFQMHMKMLDMASTNEQSANQLLNFNG